MTITLANDVKLLLTARVRSEFLRGTPAAEALEILTTIRTRQEQVRDEGQRNPQAENTRGLEPRKE